VGLAILLLLVPIPSKKNDHNHSRYADLFTANIPACEDFLVFVGITMGSA